jgi:hypothetical protein
MRGAIPLDSPCLHDVVLKLSTGATVFRSSCGHHRGRFEAETFSMSQEFVLSRKRLVGLHETEMENGSNQSYVMTVLLTASLLLVPYLEPKDYTPHPPIQFLKYMF